MKVNSKLHQYGPRLYSAYIETDDEGYKESLTVNFSRSNPRHACRSAAKALRAAAARFDILAQMPVPLNPIRQEALNQIKDPIAWCKGHKIKLSR